MIKQLPALPVRGATTSTWKTNRKHSETPPQQKPRQLAPSVDNVVSSENGESELGEAGNAAMYAGNNRTCKFL